MPDNMYEAENGCIKFDLMEKVHLVIICVGDTEKVETLGKEKRKPQ